MYISLGVPSKVMADKNETIRLNAVGSTLIVPLAKTNGKKLDRRGLTCLLTQKKFSSRGLLRFEKTEKDTDST
jgi:hypothetical protein